MDHFAPRSVAGAGFDLPSLRRGSDQQAARGGAGAAQRLPVAAYRGRAAGLLHAKQGLGVELVARRRMFEADLAEIDLKLLSEQHGHRGVRPLSHLHFVHNQGHRPSRAMRTKALSAKVFRLTASAFVPGAGRLMLSNNPPPVRRVPAKRALLYRFGLRLPNGQKLWGLPTKQKLRLSASTCPRNADTNIRRDQQTHETTRNNALHS